MFISHVVEQVKEKVRPGHAVLVGISGIDASGKGFVTEKFAAELNSADFRVAIINADGWLNLPYVRFNSNRPYSHFYEHALRLEEMFERLVLPLKAKRSIRSIVNFAVETALEFTEHEYCFENIDVILLEGIFLFKRKYQDLFDLKIWIECSFATALERAVKRSQEGLSETETLQAYKNIYFPAQRIHFEKDRPRESADLLFPNNI